MPSDRHNNPSFTPPHQECGKRLYISQLRQLIGFVTLVLAVFNSAAQISNDYDYSVEEVRIDSTEIHFRQSQSNLDLNLDNNGARLDRLPKEPKSFYMDLRTNMLYDLAAIPNIGAEFYLGKNFSILANWMYSWWDSNPRHRYWRIYGGDIGARWWFGNKAHTKPLTGHHLGIYGGVLTFDFEWGDKGYMGGVPKGTLWDRCLVNSGIEYGYSLPIGPYLNIDFSIGFGYLGGRYIKYFPFDNEYFREKEYKMNYFGPTKAEITLIWLIGRGNRNIKKGGEK